MAVHAQTAVTDDVEGAEAAPEGLFWRGVRLIASYVRMHPRPFLAAVFGAVLFAVG